jgi:serpin B
MKPKISLIAVLVLFAGLHQAAASLTDQQKLAAANNGFAFKLLKQLAKDQPTANIFISPYSVSTVLQMVGNGAVGQTKTEMQQVLGTADLPDAVVNEANKQIGQSLNSQNTNVILNIANGIWYGIGGPPKPEFIACNQQFYGFSLEPFTLGDLNSAEINKWASEKTHGRITHIADGLMGVDTPTLFLANVVYFKGKWTDQFEVKNTKDQPFHLRSGGQKSIPMMAKTKTFAYFRGTDYQAVRLPYQGKNLAMYVFLPDTNSSPEKLLDNMTGDNWRRITKPGFIDKEGTLVLPKFKLGYGVGLNQPLHTMGMKLAFEQNGGDFSGIYPSTNYRHHEINALLQETFVEVNEEGTEAAAMTVAFFADKVETPFRMIVDRPFLFLIEDKQTGTILFMGVMFDPVTN